MTRSKQTKILAVREDKSVCMCHVCWFFFCFVLFFLITFIGYNTSNDNTYIYMEEK